MFKLITRKHMEITEDIATDLLEQNTYEHQRSVDDLIVQWYSEEILIGMFLTGAISMVKLAYDNSRIVMANGQHQCWAVLMAKMPIWVSRTDYICETERDFSDLFSRFDANRIRTLNQLLVPEASALGIDWKKRIVSLVVSAAALSKERVRTGGCLTKQERKSLLGKNQVDGDFVDSIIQDGPRCRHMKRASVIRAMMDTYAVDKKIAPVFWSQVRDGTNLACNHPALRLRDYLTGATQESGAATREMYVKCIHAWFEICSVR